MKNAWRIVSVVALLALAATAMARTPSKAPESVRKQIEVSMLLSGSIEIEPDGSVAGYAIDHREQVPEHVTSYLERHLPAWRFEPTLRDGKAVAVHTPMNVRIVARPVADGVFALSIAAVDFADDASDRFRFDRVKPPRYPGEAALVGGKGIVYLVLLINQEGRVENLFVEQVNLTAIGAEADMAKLRGYFAKAASKAAWKWTFHVPASAASQPWLAARVPVEFQLKSGAPPYGTWQAYLPGTRSMAPWARDGASPDAIPGGSVRLVGGGVKLLTPLQEG